MFLVVIYKPAARKLAVVFTEVYVYLTWCYLNPSALLKNEKIKSLKAQNYWRQRCTAVPMLHCVSSSHCTTPNEQWGKYGLSGLLAPERGVRWAGCTLLCSCARCRVCRVLHYASGDFFPIKVSISPFSPKSGFNKMALLIIETCTARKLNYIHTWYTCTFSLSNKYSISVGNDVYLLNFKSRFNQEILTDSVMLWMSIVWSIS